MTNRREAREAFEMEYKTGEPLIDIESLARRQDGEYETALARLCFKWFSKGQALQRPAAEEVTVDMDQVYRDCTMRQQILSVLNVTTKPITQQRLELQRGSHEKERDQKEGGGVSRVEKIGDCTLYLGDCLEVMKGLCYIDALITDPPWGIGGLSGTTSIKRNKNAYDQYEDNEENIGWIVIPAIKKALSLADGRGLITPGQKQLFKYPVPRAIGGFYQPAAVGMSPWGFAGYNPVLFYGKDPRDGKGQNSTMTTLTDRPEACDHPCPKPLSAMLWMVDKGSLRGETVLDPFMGSGTTGVACVKLGRKFIGIEISEKYFDIACRRIQDAVDRPDMFVSAPTKTVQEKML